MLGASFGRRLLKMTLFRSVKARRPRFGISVAVHTATRHVATTGAQPSLGRAQTENLKPSPAKHSFAWQTRLPGEVASNYKEKAARARVNHGQWKKEWTSSLDEPPPIPRGASCHSASVRTLSGRCACGGATD